jgi:hypothetical protein
MERQVFGPGCQFTDHNSNTTYMWNSELMLAEVRQSVTKTTEQNVPNPLLLKEHTEAESICEIPLHGNTRI